MLAKKFRLPVQSVFGKNGETVKVPIFLLKIFQSSLPYARFGVAVGKKISAKAVARNKIKRNIFSAISELLKDNENILNVSRDYLFIASPRITDFKSEEIKIKIKEILNRS